MRFTTLETITGDQTGTIWLNRPGIHNAFNDIMIREIITAIEVLNKNPGIRIIVIRGRGKSFSSGADLNWLKNVKDFDYKENLEESMALAKCFHTIYASPKPVISVAHGAAIGGAVGLLAAADLALCTTDTILSLSEVKIGVVPACIAPYILKRIGEYRSRELMLTGRRISGKEAASLFLVNKAVPGDDLEETLNKWITELMSSGKNAMSTVKSLLDTVANKLSFDEARDETARIIAQIRTSEEAQEGMAAFLEKRKPNWI